MEEISKVLGIKIFYMKAQESFRIIDEFGFVGKRILLVSDKRIWKKCQKFFGKDFSRILTKTLFLEDPHADESNLKKVLKSAIKFDLIIAVGSGTINDLCKLSSAQLKIPYIIFPSAPSMNGYLSRNASIKISGHKKTLPATLPIAVFCDTKILSSAPLSLVKAGIGDLMCFYSCWFDWYLSHKILGTKFDEKPFRILEKNMEFFLKNFQKFSLRDDDFLKIILEMLLLSGLGMTMAGGSYPASQSEHLIAHCLEMKFPEKLHRVFHGNQIAVTTLTSSQLQKKLLSLKELQLLEVSFPQKDLEKFFGKKVALECLEEFEKKNPKPSELASINALLKLEWPNIKKDLQKIYLDEEVLKSVLLHFKIKASFKSFGVSKLEYQDSVANAKFIRNRFTCLDLY